ncbi:acyl carrier protein [Vibrio cholerae]|uniref:acyl carrier protein n=1 Tax=Vibrio cholerae TaxID=666 RepID=UPI000273465B|nr:acyl carrier protein [Vibrio cholerae]GHW84215.1 acyl carrier protein [Vibrio metoecus]EGQ9325610.1 acyl carrier protein [Vibrio cholerae]EGR0161064.1 acyl carrier protein [Vibrio cholerae]EGR0519993.1 acyl carrier protein [Vibrio cholerae]EGR2511058.1 acyl carrier protein [Vibrio cholerae]
MNNNDKLRNVFATSLGISEDLVKDDLKYNSINQWDSIAHMTLVAELENVFDVMLDTDQILDMSSVAKAREILNSHDIEF